MRRAETGLVHRELTQLYGQLFVGVFHIDLCGSSATYRAGPGSSVNPYFSARWPTLRRQAGAAVRRSVGMYGEQRAAIWRVDGFDAAPETSYAVCYDGRPSCLTLCSTPGHSSLKQCRQYIVRDTRPSSDGQDDGASACRQLHPHRTVWWSESRGVSTRLLRQRLVER